jgi:hypothetical protein
MNEKIPDISMYYTAPVNIGTFNICYCMTCWIPMFFAAAAARPLTEHINWHLEEEHKVFTRRLKEVR